MSDGARPRIIEHTESFEVHTADGRTVYFYFEDEPLRRTVAGRVTRAEARAEAEALFGGKSRSISS